MVSSFPGTAVVYLGEMIPKKTMKLALYQGSGTASDVPANLTLLSRVAEKAANQGADFLVLPELFLTGYNIGDDAWKLAVP